LGSIAEQYLDGTRHIDVTKLPADIHRALRFHPGCVFGPGTYLPCLIALMRDPLTDAPVGIQRIALERRNGCIEKIDRRMLGRAGVVKLWPATSTLVVGEGLETVLAAARIPHRDARSSRLGRLSSSSSPHCRSFRRRAPGALSRQRQQSGGSDRGGVWQPAGARPGVRL
jgi:hypothetical protein